MLDTAWATRCEDDDDRDDHVWPAAGHDAWVVGDEPVVFLDFAGAATYAKPS